MARDESPEPLPNISQIGMVPQVANLERGSETEGLPRKDDGRSERVHVEEGYVMDSVPNLGCPDWRVAA